MRRFETPYVADWFAASLRWIVLVGLVVVLSVRDQLGDMPFLPLTFIFIWNTIMSLLAVFSIRARVYHRQVVLAMDTLLAVLFFWLQKDLGGTVSWVGLIPILTGAVYFEAIGAFVVAIIFAIWQYTVATDFFFKSDPASP